MRRTLLRVGAAGLCGLILSGCLASSQEEKTMKQQTTSLPETVEDQAWKQQEKAGSLREIY